MYDLSRMSYAELKRFEIALAHAYCGECEEDQRGHASEREHIRNRLHDTHEAITRHIPVPRWPVNEGRGTRDHTGMGPGGEPHGSAARRRRDQATDRR